jgi:cysteine-rich repeat protein
VVDSTENNNIETSIVAVSPTSLHISYYDLTNADLKYATNVTGGWVTSTVNASNGGSYNAIAADISGDVSIAWVDQVADDIEFAQNFCGDSTVDASEECDDGNETDSDGCSSVCETEIICGDGAVDASEECDDGNTAENDDCLTTCLAAKCGDAIVWNTGSGTETCDDGDMDNQDTCTVCQTAVCGDGYIWTPVNGGTESCDDGNTTTGDGCDSSCHLESAPDAKAGTSLRVAYGTGACGPTCTKFYLDGRMSSDLDLDMLTYSWAVTARPAGTVVSIASSTSARTATTVKPGPGGSSRGAYTFTLTVTDADGYTDTATVTFTVY